jgi:hypothetical protein
MHQKLTKHDVYLEQLSRQINNDYDLVLKGVPLYSKRNRLVGEIDLLAIKDDYCDIYEVKCSPRITKAKFQLRKIRKLLYNKNVRNTFFFCGASGMLMTL